MEKQLIADSWKPRLQDVSAFMAPLGSIRIQMLRLDEAHPVVSGNKWFKLKENITAAIVAGKNEIATFGGAYSNHLIAAAAAAQYNGLQSTGIVRGEAEYAANTTLSACAAYGMKLVFVSRSDYRKKDGAGFLQHLLPASENYFIIPEGGCNNQGRQGAGEIAAWIPQPTTHVAIPAGTGTTLAGIMSRSCDKEFLGFCATKEYEEQAAFITQWAVGTNGRLQMVGDNAFGGFGKWNSALITFIREFFSHTGIPLDVVYTGKMMYAMREHIRAGYFPAGADILCIHTGGLQGNPAGLFAA